MKREIFDPEFQESSKKLSKFGRGFYDYWSKHKKPSTPILDHVASAAWSQYESKVTDKEHHLPGSSDSAKNQYEISAWKAYMLNPRSVYYIDDFWDEFIRTRVEYEAQIPSEFTQELKKIFE